ncbi:Acylphosphatase-2 [Blattella germanica]|nr:Acylphosphatase-2 [Blattella germanica]
MSHLKTVTFEIYGKVQGVFFRKHTYQEAKRLGLLGWCMNTDQGTVLGCIEGPEDKVEEMKNWLRNVGSPKSTIDKAEFTREENIEKVSFTKFNIRRY